MGKCSDVGQILRLRDILASFKTRLSSNGFLLRASSSLLSAKRSHRRRRYDLIWLAHCEVALIALLGSTRMAAYGTSRSKDITKSEASSSQRWKIGDHEMLPSRPFKGQLG
ncbi:hypothetical protein BD410DRAFT_789232 [Rickenella mellea]|uniref:Uncharacterized protein n=1 Tax=Rickenella mellea TaxID=50990 RepID=A0A4Y7Q2H9_9AGAM|nr:hypothetical protein BD410DRAFT_789232 [Rickenella mellea]